jgi:very-short-patch-repair endonuclease|tara:strand:- start:342 stop:2132 length:1791 start_codon:yes stop_codon:yes gene_type:complete
MDKQEEKQPDDNVIDDISIDITTIILDNDITTSVKCKNKKIGRSRLCDKNCDICFNNSFASHEKSQYWSNENVDEKGEFISPRIFPKASTIKCKFNCDKCHHVFESVLSGISQGKWCPYCFNKLCNIKDCIICFNKSFASNEKSQYWSIENVDLNGEFISPRDVTKHTTKRYKFNCDKCHHVFESILNCISSGTWCPHCAINKLCNLNDCSICFNKSFASHEKSQYWSNENIDEKNKFISPRDVPLYTNKKYKFDCDKCHHMFESILNSISNGSWCPYCVNKICYAIDCNMCFNKSFASHEKSQYWSIENVDEQGNFILTRNISKYTNKSYKFDCPKCHHTFESILSSISKGVWCPFCGSNNLCNATDCDICFDKSFASNEKSKYWSIENVDKENKFISPRDVTKSTSKIFKFNCIECSHMFESCLHNISNGKWCPFCKNKTELILQNFLKNNYENIETQYKTTWCINTVNNRNYRYDFVLHNHNIIIELDGRQHFIQVSNWNSPYKQFLTDKYKEYCANNNEYSIIRILQNDVYFNKNNWIEKLNNSISKIIEDGVIQNIYMCENNEYHQYLNFNWKHIINSIKIIKRFYLKYIK